MQQLSAQLCDIVEYNGTRIIFIGIQEITALFIIITAFAACGTYETIQQPGEARTQMLAAMKEVQQLSVYEGIHLTEQEITKWAAMCDTLFATDE